MKEIFIDVKLTNYADIEDAERGFIKKEDVRSVSIKGKLDTGSAVLVIPEWIAEKLGLRKIKEIMVEYANGSKERRLLTSGVEVEINGRTTLTNAVIGSNDKILISGHIIEDMDFIIDTIDGKVKPRHPDVDLPVAIID
jgi:predicted aspartyl protease